MPFAPTVLVSKLRRKHQEYATFAEAWTEIDLLRATGARLQANADRFLIKRPKEPADIFAERLSRFVDEGLISSVLGWYSSKLFRSEPVIKLSPDTAEDFWDPFFLDCNRAGKGFVDFFSQVFISAVSFKRAWVLIDMPRVDGDEGPRDRAEELAMGLDQPYLVLYTPLSVLNWGTDDYGALEWAVIECQESESTSPFEPVEGAEHLWYFFDRSEYATYKFIETKDNKLSDEKATAELVSSGPHALSDQRVCPLLRVEVTDELWLANRALLELKSHINLENAADWALYMACMAIPYVFSGDFDQSTYTVSEHGVLLSKDTSSSAGWLEPSGVSFKAAQEALAYKREEIFRICHLQAQGRSSSASASASSGYSKEMDMTPANDILNKYGQIIIRSMEKTIGMIAAARKEDVKVDVTGMRFETAPISEEVDVFERIMEQDIPSPTMEKILEARIAMAALADSAQSDKDKAKAEIEAAPSRADRAQERADAAMEKKQETLTNAFAGRNAAMIDKSSMEKAA